jgi:hypothetical protein
LIRLQDKLPVEVGGLVTVELMLNRGPSQSRKCMYFRGAITRVVYASGQPPRIGVQFDYVDVRGVAELEYGTEITAIM